LDAVEKGTRCRDCRTKRGKEHVRESLGKTNVLPSAPAHPDKLKRPSGKAKVEKANSSLVTRKVVVQALKKDLEAPRGVSTTMGICKTYPVFCSKFREMLKKLATLCGKKESYLGTHRSANAHRVLKATCLVYDNEKHWIGHAACMAGKLVVPGHFGRVAFYRVPGSSQFMQVADNIRTREFGDFTVYEFLPIGLQSLPLKAVVKPTRGNVVFNLAYKDGLDNALTVNTCELGGCVALNSEIVWFTNYDTFDGYCGSIVFDENGVLGFHTWGDLIAGKNNAFVAFPDSMVTFLGV